MLTILEIHPDAENEKLLKTISELQSKLEGANAQLASEQEKVCLFMTVSGFIWKKLHYLTSYFQAKKLAMENAKLQYRISHLVQAVRDGDSKLENLTGKNFSKLTFVSDNNLSYTLVLQLKSF